jgi:hypothetical protein
MYEFRNGLIGILGKIEKGQCDTIDFYRRAFEFVWGAKLSTIQTKRKSLWSCDFENLKSVWTVKKFYFSTASLAAKLVSDSFTVVETALGL